jgi:hypothetical protein
MRRPQPGGLGHRVGAGLPTAFPKAAAETWGPIAVRMGPADSARVAHAFSWGPNTGQGGCLSLAFLRAQL